jgi:hypothetical protein
MRKYALLAFAAALTTGACAMDPSPPAAPPPPPAARVPSPPAPPPTGALTITGAVTDTSGVCHTILADNGTRYAVHRGVLGGMPSGARVRVIGFVAARQDCPGSTVLRVNRVNRVG